MDDVFHNSMLWPVRLVLPNRTGWSLWGGNTPNGRDFLLPVGSRYAVFDSAEALCQYLRRDRSTHALSRTPGWPHLLQSLPTRTPDVSRAAAFRLDRLAQWNPESAGEGLVDCLDLIRDLGDQFNDPLLIGFSRPGGPLRQLYDVLWGDADSVIKPEQVAKATKQAVVRVAALASWNSGTKPE
jgi:hypothetical protein